MNTLNAGYQPCFCYLFKDFRVIFAKSQWENFCHIAPYINIALFYCSVHWCGCGCRHRVNHRCSCGGLLCYEEQKVSQDFAPSPLNELLNQKVHLSGRFFFFCLFVCFFCFCNPISYNSQHFLSNFQEKAYPFLGVLRPDK